MILSQAVSSARTAWQHSSIAGIKSAMLLQRTGSTKDFTCAMFLDAPGANELATVGLIRSRSICGRNMEIWDIGRPGSEFCRHYKDTQEALEVWQSFERLKVGGLRRIMKLCGCSTSIIRLFLLVCLYCVLICHFIQTQSKLVFLSLRN